MILLEESWVEQKLDYAHNDPVEAGWSNDPREYFYSSVRNYANLESPMKVTSLYDRILI